MADTKLSALTAATPAAGDLVYLVQGGNSRRATAQGIANLAPATNLAYEATTRVLSSSTGDDVTLPLATTTLPGLLSAADKIKIDGGQAQTVTVTVRNNTASAIGKGVPVYVTGSSGTTITIAPADASTEGTAAETLGLTAASIAANADGTVIAVGELTGLNTSALAEGQIIWLSETTGGLTTTRPIQPAHGVVVGYCVKQAAGTAGIVYVKVDNGLELAELHDVQVTGATAGQFLQLAADGLWKPRTLVAADISNGTAAGRALLTAADAAAQRTSLGLGSLATQSGSFSGTSSGTNTGDQTITLTGDVTGSGTGSFAATIAADAVTYAKIQNVSGTDRLLGRSSAGAGDVEEITCTAAGRAILDDADAAAQRTTLGLGTAATAASGDFLPSTFTAGTIPFGATVDLDMAALAGGYRTISLTGNITFTTSNRASGRTVTIRLICDGTQRTLTFPAGWVFVGTKPSTIAASKTAVLSLTFFGAADTDCVAAFGVQA